MALITPHERVKAATNRKRYRKTQNVVVYDVDAKDASYLESKGVAIVRASALALGDSDGEKTLRTTAGDVHFEKLCIATGACPRLLLPHPRVRTVRDTDSIERLVHDLSAARRVAIIGNGGLALECVGAIREAELLWVVKDEYAGNTFLMQRPQNFCYR